MSRPEASGRLAFLRNVLHPLLAIFVPLLFLVLLTELARSVIRIPLSAFAYLFLVVAGIEEVVTGNILFEEHVGSLERLREPFYLLAFVGLVLLLFERGPLTARPAAMVRPELVYLGMLVLLEWLICWRIHHGLRERELLEAALEGREGRELQVRIRDNAELARIAITAVPQLKSTIIAFQLVAFAVVVAFFAAGVRVRWQASALFLVHALAGLVAIALLNSAAEDQLLAAEGVNLSPFYRRRRLLYVLAIVGAALVLVLLYARRTSLLPLSFFQPLLDWLARLLRRKSQLQPLPYPTPAMPSPEAALMRRLQQEMGGPSPLLDLLRFLLRVLWDVARTVLILVLAYFLVAPLVSKAFRSRLRALHPLAFVREQLARFGRSLRQMLADILDWIRRPPAARSARGRRRGWRSGLAFRRAGLFKLWEMGTVLRAYVRLIRWGERQGVRFRMALAPREYLAMVSAKAPEAAPRLEEAGALLEESLFSPRRAGRERVQRYLRLVKEIVRGGGGPTGPPPAS